MKRKPYSGNALRLDGYYYLGGVQGKYFETFQNDDYVPIYFFYRNGTLGSVDSHVAEIRENRLSIKEFKIKRKHVKHLWGIYRINEDSIAFEKWYPGNTSYLAFIRIGRIINDTSFMITKSMRSDGSEVSEEDEIYCFKKFYLKPDSLNDFIE